MKSHYISYCWSKIEGNKTFPQRRCKQWQQVNRQEITSGNKFCSQLNQNGAITYIFCFMIACPYLDRERDMRYFLRLGASSEEAPWSCCCSHPAFHIPKLQNFCIGFENFKAKEKENIIKLEGNWDTFNIFLLLSLKNGVVYLHTPANILRFI